MRPTSTPTAEENEFPYGWRYINGGAGRVPLTLEDVLHPQESDVIPENIQHDADCVYLVSACRSRPLSPDHTLVSHDLLTDWATVGVGNHAPDIAVFVGMSRKPDPRTGLLRLKVLGGRCVLVIEVVSPHTRENDVVHKFAHYHRVGVGFYVVIDQEVEDGPRCIRAYRWEPSGYVEVTADGQGRVLLPIINLLLGLRDGRVVCFDAATGEEILDLAATRDRFEQFREEAEQAFADQVQARQDAERREQDAERREQDAERREQAAQRRADRNFKDAEDQRLEREKAEKLVQELQEKLRLLESGGSAKPAG